MSKSIATLASPEFINITSVSPLISQCEIKVLYVGQNRNRSFISKEVAEEMGRTLPGCPIVGYYIENKDDFGDHGEQMVIDGEGIRFNTLTKPYGFVPLEAKVWFQEFEDTDDFGNVTNRTYLMTEGYLWTGQFEECRSVIEQGRPQSMELDDKTLSGYWSTDNNCGIDFFIINDATITKLCILGDDVPPCFEGASVEAPQVTSTFTKLDGKDDFSATLFTMLKQLRELKNNEGGYSMNEVLENSAVETEEQVATQFEAEEVKTVFEDGGDGGDSQEGADAGAESEGESGTEEGTSQEGSEEETEKTASEIEEELDACVNVPKKAEFSENTEFSSNEEEPEKNFKKDSEEEDKDEKSESEENNDDKEDDSEDNSDDEEKEDDKEEENKKKYSLLLDQYNELQEKFSLLEKETVELRQFKSQIEDAEKDELIASFYMLSEEDKKDVIANKANYTLRQIKAELAMICVDKKVNFNLEDGETQKDETPTTFSLDSLETCDNALPAWLKAVESYRKSKQ